MSKAPLVIVPTPQRKKGMWVPVPDLRYCWALVADTEAPKDPTEPTIWALKVSLQRLLVAPKFCPQMVMLGLQSCFKIQVYYVDPNLVLIRLNL